VATALQQIHTHSPHAEVFLVGYPRIATADGVGCSTKMYLTPTDAPVFAAWEDTLNSTLKSVATANGARFVDMHAESTGRTACDSDTTRWINPYGPPYFLSAGEIDGAWLHPNSRGATATAQRIHQAMLAAGLNLGPEETGPTGSTGSTGQTGSTGPTTKPDPPVQIVPALKLVSIAPTRLHAARRGPIFSTRSAARGATLTVNSPLEGFALFSLERRETGRRKGRSCVKQITSNRRKPRCVRRVAVGYWWPAILAPGETKIHVSGRDERRALKPGNYSVRALLSGDDSTETTLDFKVVR
jgi:hypothetical protein